MRICIISDTHIPDRYEELPVQLVSEIKQSDLVIHAGDFTSYDLYQQIRHLKPLKAVLGNMDTPELREHLKEKETFTVKNFKIGIMHGYGNPAMMLQTIKENFDNSFDLVVFGHSHTPFQEKSGKTTYLNPGSPTDKIFAPYNTFGIVEINGDLRAKIERIGP
ncbi:putative metallophosphoesterase [Candidatus Velamenicoccus archaeovorus]|uniref:Phosphoesterase n=1 Tax=Velamenicoccus archaeovorus TaxID=1930593 RepID=A0A410P418_VELA1|nr:metallophosphoesterase family protein [Candidatus Velamenicoccus archaeovorus]QAT16906.1 putative metallophosphoesterase [Candidatus Velamenicoccus archaeovorus]